jgi:1-phosphofructokinase family hexose kinase
MNQSKTAERSAHERITTVTLNPAIDQTISVPHFAVDQVNRVEASRSDPGGKGVNVASILADRGLPVTVTGFLGAENTRIFEELFTRKEIEDRFVRIAGYTRTGIKVIDEVNGTTTDINFPGQPPTAADTEALLAAIRTLADRSSWFVMSGSLPAGAPTTLYRSLIETVRAVGRKVALDTSGPALEAALDAGPTLVKPNIHEMEALLGSNLPDQDAVITEAQRWRERHGIDTVVVSLGEAGALLVADGIVLHARPPKVAVKSTVGAGDAMVSGLIAGLYQGMSPGDCLALGTAFAAGAITFVGSGLPPAERLAALQARVIVTELDTSSG